MTVPGLADVKTETGPSNLLKSYYRNGGGKQKGFLGVVWYERLSSDSGMVIEEHFGVMRMNADGTVYCKDAWLWLVGQTPNPLTP